MKGKTLFLRWALFMSLVTVGCLIGINLGWLKYLKSDPTHLTLATIATFLLATAWLGRLSWRLSSGADPAEVEEDLSHGWFASSLCVSIGLAGTAIGYYLMLQNGNATGDPSTVIREAFAHTSIAIINTVTGAICGILLEVQSHFVGHAVKKALRLKENES